MPVMSHAWRRADHPLVVARWRVAGLAILAALGVVRSFAGHPVEHWAYQPIRTPDLPSVQATHWPVSPVDHFILASLEAADLTPSPDADRATLGRRVTLDLIGLPPSPEELDAFVGDPQPDTQALERLVDRLLASPRFGEHWARRWFDVVRFAESVTLRGFLFKEAWRYRDYVIQAFNEDRPIDQFLREQIAGDLLPADSVAEKQRQLIATTFLMLGNTNLEEQDKKQLEMDVVDEQLDVLSKALLGQTVSCARCHDHKFDPIPTRDYYALAGILKNSLAIQHDNVSAWIERPLPVEPELEALFRQREDSAAALRAAIQAARKNATNEVTALEARLNKLLAFGPPRPMVMAPRETTNVVDLAIHQRGSVHRLGDVVPRGFLEVAAQGAPPPPGSTESGRRELAAWIVSDSNPLTRRVFVNRVWLGLMGQGLVRTPDNFGTTGLSPTHPALLDWLASAFGGVSRGREGQPSSIRPWSLKGLVRELALSRTYRLQGEPSEFARESDPENRLISHATRKRLTAEQLRDAMLAISGQLRLDSPNGPTYPPALSADYGFVASEPRRSVYVPVFRNAQPELFNVFDFPPTSMVTGQRSESTVPTQALFLLNDPWVREQAEATQRRILTRFPAREPASSETWTDSIPFAYRLTLGRSPSPVETRTLQRHLATAEDPAVGWTDAVQALFASAEFRLLN